MKKGTLLSRLLFVTKCFLCALLSVGLGLLYVWQNVQIVETGFKIKEKEKKVLDLLETKHLLETEQSILKMPKRVQSQIEKNHIPIGLAGNWQFVHIEESPFFYENDLHVTSCLNQNSKMGHTIINIAKLKVEQNG